MGLILWSGQSLDGFQSLFRWDFSHGSACFRVGSGGLLTVVCSADGRINTLPFAKGGCPHSSVPVRQSSASLSEPREVHLHKLRHAQPPVTGWGCPMRWPVVFEGR